MAPPRRPAASVRKTASGKNVVPFQLPEGISERWLLILFHNREAPSSDGHHAPSHSGKSRWRDELRATKDSLQAIIEEQEAWSGNPNGSSFCTFTTGASRENRKSFAFASHAQSLSASIF